MKLTAKRVAEALKCPGRYGDGHGLVLQVVGPHNASWIYRFQRDGKERWHGLGPVHTVSLGEARIRAKQVRLQLLDGVDPVDAKRAAKAQRALEAAKAMTFRQCADAFIEARESGWRNAKHRQQWRSTLETYVLPRIGDLPVGAIDVGLVLKCVEPIWKERTETASRVRGRIEAVLDWATVRGYRNGDNPARWRGHLEHLLTERGSLDVKHYPALAYAELPVFMARLRACQGVAARALEFLILTAARSGEVLGARWGEIDLGEAVWTVPAVRIKGGREHRVPLSKAAIELLRGLYREAGNDFVFIGARAGGLNDAAMAKVLRHLGQDGITVHGFRSTFRDFCAERTNTPREIVEMALAHRIAGQAEAAYSRGDVISKRRKLAETWAQYCARLAAGDVVPMHGRRRVR